MALADIYQKATLVQIPSGYKAADAELYSVVPNTTAGDFTVSVDADATRVNKDGLVESVLANQARLDYNPTNPQDPTLLLEPQRTNQISKSRDLEGWTDLNGSETTTNNDAVAPNGSNTAATIKKTGSDNSTLRFFTTHTNFSTVRSASVYIKKLSGNPTVSFGVTDTQVSITPTDEWVRYTKDNVTPTNFGVNIFVDIEVSGVSGDKIAVWGAQLEEGTYSTSVIETTGVVLTRTQDRCINGGDDALFNDSEGVLFADLEALGDGTTARKISLSDGSTDFVSIEFTTVAGVIAFSAGSTNNTFFSSVAVSGQTPKNRNKIAIKYKSGNTDCFINGTKVLTRTEAFTLSGLDRVNFENRATSGSQNMFAKIHQLMVFNEALTDAELTTLTT